MHTKLGTHTLPLITLLSFLALPLHAQPGEPIGTVLATKGRVEVRAADGALRTLARRSPLYLRDTIVVGSDGYASIRMIDAAEISFRPNTEFWFQSYSFDANPATADEAVMSMLRGGFRTISGSIGDSDNDNYRVD